MANAEEKKPENKNAPVSKKPEATKSDKPQGSGKGLLIVLILLVVALAGGLVFMYLENQDLKNTTVTQVKTIETKGDEIDRHLADLESLNDEYGRVMAERDALGLNNDSIKSELSGLNAKIKALKSRSWKSEAERKKLELDIKKLTAQFTLKLTEKDEEIVRLTELSETLTQFKDSLVHEHSNMLAENATLADVVALASVLEVENLKITCINAKGKELDKDIYKSKVISKVKSAFNIGGNEVSELGIKEVFMLMKDPSGTVLFDINKGGGAFTKHDGNQDFFTQKLELDFKNEADYVTFTYELSEDEAFISGNYTIEIWESGYLIGTSKLAVK